MRDVLDGLLVLMKNYGGKKFHVSSPSSGLSSFWVRFGSGLVRARSGLGSVPVGFGFGSSAVGFWFGSGLVRFGFGSGSAGFGVGSCSVTLGFGSGSARFGFDFCLIMFHRFDELIHFTRSYKIIWGIR